MADAPRYGTIDHDYAQRLATTPPDEDGPVWMVNLIQHRDRADYADGRETSLTGREADDRYSPYGPLEEVGAEVVLVADVQDQFLNETPRWDRLAVVKYPTRASFIAMQSLPEFQELHAHKEAGVAQTIVIGTTPFPSPETEADRAAAAPWDQVPHPPTPEDGYVQVVHVLRFEDDGVGEDVGDGGGTPGEMDEYTKHATKVAVEQGVRIGGWFKAEGTILGDGRRWDQVRFNTFPSRAAFMEVVFDPERLAAQAEHREKAIAETYTLVLRPVVDRLNDPELVAFALERMGGYGFGHGLGLGDVVTRRRVALIADGKHYVGPALARLLADRGHDLVLGDPDDDTVAAAEAAGADVVRVQEVQDLASPEAAPALVDAALTRFGRVDAAVVFSGQIVVGRFLQSSVEDLQKVLRGCVEAPYQLLRAVVPPMVDQEDGQVLVITSASAARPTFGAPLYSSARAELATMLARNVAEEVVRKNVQVNAVGTNFMDFPEFLRANGADDPEVRAKVEAQVPMRRLGNMDEFAHFCLPYVDGTSRFTTGQFTAYAGGWA